MSMITAVTWVRRGVAATFPTKYDIDDAELSRISKLAKLQVEDAKEDLQEARSGSTNEKSVESDEDSDGGVGLNIPKDDDDLKEYNLDHYDSDEVDEEGEPSTMFGNVKSLAYHEAGEEDPYLVLPEEEDDEEREELQILASDNLLLAAKVEDEVALLEVYVYEDDADNLYVHHDIMLPAIPLCLEWLDVPVGDSERNVSAKANFVAVGTFEPGIEIWDLDVVDRMYPNAILGQGGKESADDQGGSKKKKKKKMTPKVNDEFHVDAVLSLAANRQHRNLLASSSADKTIKLWDLNTTKCAKSYSYHTDKVCALDWHPKESTVLLSGSYDRTVAAADMRAPDATVPRWRVESDVETVRWDPHDSNYFYVTTEQGMVHFHDVRNAPKTPDSSKPVWTLQAHNSNVSSFDINPIIPGFLATGSMDKQVKLWNVQSSGPSMVVSRDLGLGKVFSTQFAPDQEVGFRLAVAGSRGAVQVWDTSTNAGVRRAFANRVSLPDGDVKERLVGTGADSSESEDGEDDVEGRTGGNDGWESKDKD